MVTASWVLTKASMSSTLQSISSASNQTWLQNDLPLCFDFLVWKSFNECMAQHILLARSEVLSVYMHNFGSRSLFKLTLRHSVTTAPLNRYNFINATEGTSQIKRNIYISYDGAYPDLKKSGSIPEIGRNCWLLPTGEGRHRISLQHGLGLLPRRQTESDWRQEAVRCWKRGVVKYFRISSRRQEPSSF